MGQDEVLLYAVGDICPRDKAILALAAPALKEADIRFGQLETNLSDRGAPQMNMLPGVRVPPENINAFTYAGFDIVSFAGNHTLDFGEEAFFDTVDVVQRNGIAIVGVGKNIAEARQPVIMERKGTRIAFLAYCSALPKGYEARPDKPGCAPMRASTFYEQVDWQAGSPPRIISQANKEDLAALTKDVRKASHLADVVVVSMHWGVHYARALVAAYQKEVGHAAIDAGADLILGHHAHILKPVEVYKGKVIFYSLCNFAMDIPIAGFLAHTTSPRFYGWKVDPAYPTYPFPPDSRKSMIAKIIMADKQIKRVSFLPVLINKRSQPRVLHHKNRDFRKVIDYMAQITAEQDLDTRYQAEGDEVTIPT